MRSEPEPPTVPRAPSVGVALWLALTLGLAAGVLFVLPTCLTSPALDLTALTVVGLVGAVTLARLWGRPRRARDPADPPRSAPAA